MEEQVPWWKRKKIVKGAITLAAGIAAAVGYAVSDAQVSDMINFVLGLLGIQ